MRETKSFERKRKLTQDQLAKIANIPNITLIKIETWKILNPWIENIIKIVNALNWSFDELLKLTKKKMTTKKTIKKQKVLKSLGLLKCNLFFNLYVYEWKYLYSR